MKTIFKAGLLAFLIGGSIAFPVQKAEAATHCYVRNGHWVCNGANVSRNRCYMRNGRQICNRGYVHRSHGLYVKLTGVKRTRYTRCRRVY